MSARDTVLSRIHTALGSPQPSLPEVIAQQQSTLERGYQQLGVLAPEALLHLLEDRLLDYDAEVTRVASGGVADAARSALQARDAFPTLVPPGFPPEWLPHGCELVEDRNFSPRQLDHFSSVLTTATLAIAETGTLVLQNVPGQGRRAATLVPDFHLCVVRAVDVVETVPEAFTRLAPTATLPTTFVSGPSATADIEMTRIKGVHGPRFLHVLLVLDKV